MIKRSYPRKRRKAVNEQVKLYPLSYPQKGIWHLEKMYPDTSIGNVSATLKFETKLDRKAANDALNHVVRLNDAFRMRITERGGDAYQYISEYEYIEFDYLDFSQRDIEELYEWDREINRIPIYRTDTRLFYFAVLKISEDMAGFFVKLHHMIADAWTLVTFGNEVLTYYNRLVEGNDIGELSKPSYTEYINNEKKYFESERFLKDEEFWLDKFVRVPSPAAVKERNTTEALIRSARKTFVLPEKLCAKIRRHCAEHKTSIFSLYLGAMAIYMNRTRGENEIVFGTPVLNRTNFREKETLGMFISTVPIKVSVDESLNYTDFAEAINREWLSILRHQKYPYTILLKKLREKNPGLGKLYDIVISYQNAKFIKNGDDQYHEGRWHQNGYQTDTLVIHLNDREADGAIIVDYDYLADLFYTKEIEFLHDHVIRLLWHSIDNPVKKIASIDMISENEKHRILYEFNDTKAYYPGNSTVHGLFEERVSETPDAVSHIYGDEKITYSELNKKANKLARLLRAKGVKPDCIVGLMMDRSPDVVSAMLGIIKAGGAFLPIDPKYPKDRIDLVLEDSGTGFLVTGSDLSGKCSFNGCIIEFDRDIDDISDETDPDNVNKPGDLIYVIYTSGSTGVPKGVMIEHRSLVNFIYGVKDILEFAPGDKVLSLTTITFDIFIFENFTALLHGASVIFASEEQCGNRVRLKRLIKGSGADKLLMTPSMMQLLILEDEAPDFLRDVKVIMLGGEVFPISLYGRLKKITGAKIVNGYGPTETTIGVSFKELINQTVNIGKPIANTRMYILDRNMNLMPIGIPGELYVGGDCLSRGYLNRDDLTREKFVKNPLNGGERIYNTGDIANWYAGGEIEYIGRNDNQVKINGLRIEFGEVESQIIKVGGVSEAIAAVKEDSEGKSRLCAYVVADDRVTVQEIRSTLSKSLPKYMIPSCIMKVNSFPLTPTGKIDRKALPEAEFHLSEEKKYELPGDRVEKILAEAYAMILKTERIGIDDDFFDMGGDSLGAVELISFLFKKKLALSIQDVYEHPTIRELRKHVSSEKGEEAKRPACSITSRDRTVPLYSMISEGMIQPLDSAALTYIPDKKTAELLGDFPEDKPLLYNYMSMDSGNIGIIAIPMGINDLYTEKEKTVSLSLEGIRIAECAGAKVVSLTGLLPSATRNGTDIHDAAVSEGISAAVTTGHATTAAAVILSLKRILASSGRRLDCEKVCVLGLGSIGTALLKLMLSVMPHPLSLVLCDLTGKRDKLEGLKKETESKLYYTGEIKTVFSSRMYLPDEVYGSTLIIGATNVPDILDIDCMKPGTIIVDDSGPHCFSAEKAIRRLEGSGDILFTEGGVLETVETITNRIYLPVSAGSCITEKYRTHFRSGREITGCILSGLLSSKYDIIKPQTGEVSLDDCMENHNLLVKKGYRGAALHCEDYVITAENIHVFRKRFQMKENQVSVKL